MFRKKTGMRSILLNLIIFIYTFQLYSQGRESNKESQHQLYTELFGQGFCYSFNYEYLFPARSLNVFHGFYIGASYVPEFFQFGNGFYAGIPIGYRCVFGEKRHFFEIGFGFTSLFSKDFLGNIQYNYISPQIGYRFEPVKSPFFAKLNLMAHVDIASGSAGRFNMFSDVAGTGLVTIPWPGISLGYKLNKKNNK